MGLGSALTHINTAQRSRLHKIEFSRIWNPSMHKLAKATIVTALSTVGLLGYAFCTAAAADTLNGKVLGGGQPIANSTVTLWAAGAGAPTQLGQTRTGVDGSFTLSSTDAPKDTTLYLIAKGGQPKANAQSGDNPSIALLTVIGSTSPATVTINEMTTVASVWTHAHSSTAPQSRGLRSVSVSPLAMCPTSSIFNRAVGEQQFRTRSIAVRRQRWPTSPHWPM